MHSTPAKNELHLQGCINEGIERLFLDLLWKVPLSTIHRILSLARHHRFPRLML